MATQYNFALIVAAFLNGFAACLHVACVIGGPSWYRRFGAPAKIVSAAEAGRWYPAIVTVGIAVVLATWSAYALAGAGIFSALPLMKPALAGITGTYLLRGLAAFPLMALAPKLATRFVVWSSIACTLIGAIHLIGLLQVWSNF